MASTIFMLMDGIKGESTDSAHKDWMEATSFTHTVTVPIITGIEGGRTAGHAQEALSITKPTDASSPLLYDACTSGKHFKTVQIDFLRVSGDTRLKYMSVEMDDVLLSGITTASDPDGPLADRLSLVYGKITWTAVRNPLLDLARRQVTPINVKLP